MVVFPDEVELFDELPLEPELLVRLAFTVIVALHVLLLTIFTSSVASAIPVPKKEIVYLVSFSTFGALKV